MSSRLKAYQSLANHAHYAPLFKRLTNADHQIILEFFHKYQDASDSDFLGKVLVLFLDKPNKPKNWPIIEDLLIASATIAREEKSGGSIQGR